MLTEQYARRSWIEQQWCLYLDSFPVPRGGEILLERSPVISIDEVGYTDAAGVDQVLSPTLYQGDVVSEPGRLLPAYGQAWPATRPLMNAVRVKFTSGYADDEVPRIAKLAMLHAIGSWYENREGVTTGTIATVLPGLAERLLDSGGLRVFRFG